jgi:hypothetical protein
VGGIRDQVDQHLVSGRGVRQRAAVHGLHVRLHHDCARDGGPKQAKSFGDDRRQRDRLQDGVLAPAEAQQVLYDIATPQGGSQDLLEILGCRVVFGQLLARQLGVTNDATEQVVEVVSDAASEGPYGF